MKLWTRFEQFFKHKQLRFLEIIMGRQLLDPESVNWAQIHRILVVRQHDQLGDFLLSTPVFCALRKKCPDADISVIARRYTVLLVENHDCLNSTITFYEHGKYWNWKNIRRFVSALRKGYDLTIVLNTVSHSLTSDIIAYFSKAPYILGSEHCLFEGTKRNFFYNLGAPYINEKRSQSERNLDIVRYIGVEYDDAREHIFITEEEHKWAQDLLTSLGKDQTRPLVAIHPGAGKLGNRWGAENFAVVANKLAAEYNAQLFVTWGPDENELGRQLLDKLDHPAFSWNNKNIKKIAAVLAQADLFLCNDTGVMHVGAACDTPLVAVFGPTDPAEWKPVGDQFVAIRGKDGQCSSVSTTEVFDAACKLLK